MSARDKTEAANAAATLLLESAPEVFMKKPVSNPQSDETNGAGFINTRYKNMPHP